jgi:hypothetical protein
MRWYEVILDYLRVALSWPVMALAIAFIFRNELRRLPGRLEQVVWDKNTKRLIFTPEQSRKINRDLSRIIKKPQSARRRKAEIQKDMDKVFELGVALGLASQGQNFTNISNVRLLKDDEGNVTGLQYDETG